MKEGGGSKSIPTGHRSQNIQSPPFQYSLYIPSYNAFLPIQMSHTIILIFLIEPPYLPFKYQYAILIINSDSNMNLK